MRDTAAHSTVHGLYALLAPQVGDAMLRMPGEFKLLGAIASPQCTVTAADRAIAVDEKRGLCRNLDVDTAAMATSDQHILDIQSIVQVSLA